MKKRFSDAEIVGILVGAAKTTTSISTFCREKGISEQAFYAWKRKFNGVENTELKRLKELEKENARLKKIVVERDLEIEIMKEHIEKKS